MTKLEEYNKMVKDELHTIENAMDYEYAAYDTELNEILPESFYEHIRENLSDFYKQV